MGHLLQEVTEVWAGSNTGTETRMTANTCGKRGDRVFQAEGTDSAKALRQNEVSACEEEPEEGS